VRIFVKGGGVVIPFSLKEDKYESIIVFSYSVMYFGRSLFCAFVWDRQKNKKLINRSNLKFFTLLILRVKVKKSIGQRFG